LLGLGLLHAEDVGVLGAEPVEEALARGGADAVGVETDDAHGAAGAGKTDAAGTGPPRSKVSTAAGHARRRGRPVSARGAACWPCSAAGSGTPPSAGARSACAGRRRSRWPRRRRARGPAARCP